MNRVIFTTVFWHYKKDSAAISVQKLLDEYRQGAIIHTSSYEKKRPNRSDRDGMGAELDHFAVWRSGLAEQLTTFENDGVEYAKRLAGGGVVI